MGKITQPKFRDYFIHWHGHLHQIKAVDALYDRIAKADPSILDSTDRWAKLYTPDEPAKASTNPTAASPFSTYLTEHFQYGEVCLWQEARRFRSDASLKTAIKLLEFCEKARAHFKSAIIITSGHRPEPINSRVGGAPNSEHTFHSPGVGALDIALERGNQYDLQSWCEKNWPYSVGRGAPAFVHIGFNPGNTHRRWNY